ncbi:hydantoinase/oxoprolinase family protein [uncultured Paludibaculum sp.]|uniref:hydantoinase/oxoprolinase family protein n=1 Tax=uncultured Paludibaculum sp. TaxID=1765020 RepID=UPI002AAB8ADE|nr:hydantoinase/oxoprolinase family protein [uncultured Paludibaculum sp.]
MRIGIDAGGTFTDFVVLHDNGRLETFKLRSNPKAPHEVILTGLARVANPEPCDVIHGSTVATNALLERKGARTAFLTTAGFEDLLEIGRQNRAELYNLTPGPKRLLIPPELCYGVKERTLADGSIESVPSGLAALRTRLRRAGVQSVAVCFLHAYRTPANEQAVAEALGDSFYLSISHRICPEFREFERASTTALNAYVGPLMRNYLSQLGRATHHRVWIVQSNGGSITVGEAGDQAVRTILSGPAGGVTGAAETARASGFRNVLGFDMGGTSTDVSLCDGAPRETLEASVDGLPVKLPMLEIHTVGAGGGSIAYVDSGGLLRVGPESAGADPGPACYGTGTRATTTDAHVVLGRIAAHQLVGGSMTLQPDRAQQAVQSLARELNLSETDTAAGILRVANATMGRAIRVVSIERGYDPRDFALLAFGGCGGLHACELAEDLGISTVLVPALAGALSALGMLLADRIRDYSAGALGQADLAKAFTDLEQRALAEMPGARLQRFADLRYLGQSYELTVPWHAKSPARPFHELHKKTYGYANPQREVEIVTLRVRARIAVRKPRLRDTTPADSSSVPRRRFYTNGKWTRGPVYQRAQVGDAPLAGPALILDYGSTTLIPPRWQVRRDPTGMLVVERSRPL